MPISMHILTLQLHTGTVAYLDRKLTLIDIHNIHTIQFSFKIFNEMLDVAISLFFEQFLKRIVWVIEKKSVAMFWTHQTKT